MPHGLGFVKYIILLKTRWRDGTTHILMEPYELLERLVPLIPPPRAQQVRYHGVLAPCTSARDRVVPGPRPTPGPALDGTEAREPSREMIPAAVGIRAPGSPEIPHRRTDRCAPAEPGPPASARRLDELESGANESPARGSPRPPDRRDPPDAAAARPRPRRLPWADLLQRVFEVDALRCPRCGARMRVLAAIEEPGVAHKILACLDLPARAPPLLPAPSAPTTHETDSWGEGPAWMFDQTSPDGDGIG